MDAGGLAQMTSNSFAASNGLGVPSGGFSSRRGAQNIKPLSFDTLKQANGISTHESTVPTPRTSRSHLLAGLRTAPKTSAASFGSGSHTAGAQTQYPRNTATASNFASAGQDNYYSAPRTAMPQYRAQQNGYQSMVGQQYTVDQVLAPPELPIDDQSRERMDPDFYAQLVATNMFLAQQQQRLQQQLRNVQAAALQFQQLNMNNPQLVQQQLVLNEQQQQLQTVQQNMQQQYGVPMHMNQVSQQIYYNPVTGQCFFDASAAAPQIGSHYAEQPMSPAFNGYQHQLQLQQPQQQRHGTPRVQVSPPPENQSTASSNVPLKRNDTAADVAPLPPPSAQAFRRGHRKSNSLAPLNSALAASATGDNGPKSAGPKTASFPLTPATGGYGPGQARAGEHPVRQPRCPPSLDELKARPTAKHEGSKNFATRTRRSAVHNLVRAGLERRKGAGSSSGSMSPVSETVGESVSPITDNDSESGRSGSGSLAGEMEYASSQTSTSGIWGPIGSDRPSSRQKARQSSDGDGGDNSSFAHVFKSGNAAVSKGQDSMDGQSKGSRLVLTSLEKRKASH